MVSDEGLVVMEIPVAADDDMGLTAPALLTHRLPGKYKSSGKIQEELKKKRSCALRTGLVKKNEDSKREKALWCSCSPPLSLRTPLYADLCVCVEQPASVKYFG